jgi:hypothetical protein
MLEPPDDIPRFGDDAIVEAVRPPRLRNDSYLGAIHKENLLVRAGMQVNRRCGKKKFFWRPLLNAQVFSFIRIHKICDF